MNKKSNYKPVQGNALKRMKGCLPQGTLQDHNVLEFKSGHIAESSETLKCSTGERGSKKMVIKANTQCYTPENSCNEGGDVEKVIIDIPPTLHITNASSKKRINQNKIGSHNNTFGRGSPFATTMHVDDKYEQNQVVHVTKGINDSEMIKVDQLRDKSSIPIKEVANVKHCADAEYLKRRKPSVKVVASRYMTAASSVKNRSQFIVPASKSKLSFALPVDQTPKTKNTPRKSEQQHVEGVAKASTPNSGFKSFFEPNMSTIPTSADKIYSKQRMSSIPQEKISQDDLNLAYSEYIRMAYIKTCVKQSANRRHREALNDITKLCNAQLVLQTELMHFEEDVETLEDQKKVNSLVNFQLDALGPLSNSDNVVQNKYDSLAKNIDAIRHVLPINNVVILKQLNPALNQTQTALHDILTMSQVHLGGSCNTREKTTNLQELVANEEMCLNTALNVSKTLDQLLAKKINLQLQLQTEENFSPELE